MEGAGTGGVKTWKKVGGTTKNGGEKSPCPWIVGKEKKPKKGVEQETWEAGRRKKVIIGFGGRGRGRLITVSPEMFHGRRGRGKWKPKEKKQQGGRGVQKGDREMAIRKRGRSKTRNVGGQGEETTGGRKPASF